MAKKGRRRSRYEVAGNVEAEYVDEAHTVLVNRLGITDLAQLQRAEEEALAQAYEILLGEVGVETPITCALIRHIHARIFGRLYTWAGMWRTVWIKKPGVTWPPPDFLDSAMREFELHTLAKIRREAITTDDEFARLVGEMQGEFLVIHPFREGNARTIKVLTNLLALQTGRPLLIYDHSAEGVDRYIRAAKAAFKKQYAPMVEIIRDALGARRQ